MEHITILPKNNSKSLVRANTRLGTQQSPGQKSKKKKKFQNNQRLPRYFGAAFSPVVRRTLNYFTTITSSASGAIPLASVTSAGVTVSPPSWPNISQEFENYRVRQFKIRFTPSTVNATSTTGPYQGMIMVGRFMQLAPVGQSNLEQKSDTAYHSTLEEFEFDANYLGFDLGQEWIPVGTGVSTAQRYGISYMTPAGTSALAASSDIFSARIQYEVEFKKAA